MFKKGVLKKALIALGMLPLLVLSMEAVFGQSSNSTLSGTVVDSSLGVLPGATITATNSNTNVVSTTTTNDSGVYTLSLQPGVYIVRAEMPGFQTSTKTDVKLGASGQGRLNFELNVAGTAVELEVTSTGSGPDNRVEFIDGDGAPGGDRHRTSARQQRRDGSHQHNGRCSQGGRPYILEL